MATDRSEGWEAIASSFIAARSHIGAGVVAQWSDRLPPGSAVLDAGCGSGLPIARMLADKGFAVHGFDASPTLVAAFRENLPDHPVACEAVQDSSFFGRKFAGAIAVGLIFLLSREDQKLAISRLADCLEPGGHLLFSSPREACEWDDMLTGRRSLSLGKNEYTRLLAAAGMRLAKGFLDEGESHYYAAAKHPA